MIHRRNWAIYGVLAAIWIVLIGWQTAEHLRVREATHAGLINRAKDISNTLALVMRSQRRFGIISKERLESAMKELIKPGELSTIALLNSAGEVVASAGAPLDLQGKAVLGKGEHWESGTVTLMNIVDFGTNTMDSVEHTNVTLVLPRSEMHFETNRPPPPRPEMRTNAPGMTNPPPRPRHRPPWDHDGPNEGRFSFGRPFWMSEAEYKAASQKQGVHGLVLVMSTQMLNDIDQRDLWMRLMIGFLATVSVAGSGLAWRTVVKSSELQIRLVRASELNLHLKEMNLAAAGLAHETKNPLNIIRGLAQLISRQEEASPEVRKKSREIMDEADRLTAQLNEFINYSRPREVRRVPVNLKSVAAEVVRTLSYDIEEKQVQVRLFDEELMIQADEPLLRQMLFNLTLNAIQAVDADGQVEIRAVRRNSSGVVIEVCDNGPGVAVEHRAEVFKPYFTTRESGTGLGLAIVHQIVLAHGWEIECLANEPKGALFRITHVKLAAA